MYDWRNRQIAIDGELELYQTSGYDNLNRVVQSERRDTTGTGQLLSREAMLYDDRGRVYRSIRYGVDSVTGQITTQQDRDVTFDVAGNLLRQEPAGAMAFETYEYDLLGRRIEQTDPLGQLRQWTYDAAGNQIATTDPTNQVWTQSYDPLGRQVRMTNPLAEATRTSYDAAGRQSSVIDGVGNSSDSDYDAAGRIFASTDPLGKITTFTYDANGNQLSMADPNGNTTTSEYDYLDRRIKTIDPAGNSQQVVYNLAGETIVEIDAKGNQTLHGYDALGLKVSITDRLSHTTTFAFNACGLLANLTDAENQTTAYVYDDYARQIATIWPDHVSGSNAGDIGYGITRQAYDELNRLVRKTDQLGDTINFVYDVAGRLLARDYRTKANSPNGTIADSDTFTYDAAGRMLIANSGRYSNEVAFIYDAAGRKATESLTVLGHTYVVGTQYDAAGRIAKLIYPDSSEVHRSYTARGELYQISQKVVGGSLTVIDTRVYDDAGRMISSNYSNGVSQVHSYNTDNTLAGIAFSGASIGDLAYTWDVNHNKVSETIDGVMSGYGFTATYDAEDRLITYDRSNGNLDQAWDLTAVGDMNNVTTNTTVQARTHGPAHELLTAGVAPISTDARGNISAIPAALRSNGVKVYLNYDFDNRFNSLTANLPLSQPGALFQNYSYDALGRRVGFQGNNGQTIFVCYGQQVLCDYGVTAPPSNPNMSYIYGDYVDEPIMRSIGSGGTRLYYHRNQQYSIIALTDSSGAIQERYAYSAYGELTIANASGTTLSTSAVNNRYTYTGREWDSTIAQYYYRARMYDATLGRFCSRDPIGFKGSSWNLYQYCNAVPLSRRDPMGLASESDDLAPLPDPLPDLPEAGTKCSCKKFIEGKNTDVDGREGKKCGVKVYCHSSCPSGKPGEALLPDVNGNIRICMTPQSTEREYSLIFEHEMQHARDFCMAPPPPIDEWDCDLCRKYENHAHAVNCGMLYPDDENKRNSCISCGTYISCAKYCPGSKPSGCSWEFLGVDPTGKDPVPEIVR